MEIRQAEPGDIEMIIKIETTCFPVAEAADEAAFRSRYAVFPENFFVAEENGMVVGFINGCTTDKPELPDILYEDAGLHNANGAYQTVFGLDVLPEYRRRGVAEALLNHLIQVSKERKKKGMVLTCKEHLIHYYEKFGFVCRGKSASVHGGAVWNDMVLIFG